MEKVGSDALRLIYAFACSDFRTWNQILLVNRFSKSIGPTCTRFIVLQEVNENIPAGLLFRLATSKDHPHLNVFLKHHPELQEWNVTSLSTVILPFTWFAIRDLQSFSLSRSHLLDIEAKQLVCLPKLEFLSLHYVKWNQQFLPDILSIPSLKYFHWVPFQPVLTSKPVKKIGTIPCCELEEFRFECSGTFSLDSLLPIWPCCGSLKRLQFTYKWDDGTLDKWVDYLAKCPRLEELTIPFSSHIVQHLCSLYCLRKLTFWFPYWKSHMDDSLHWEIKSAWLSIPTLHFICLDLNLGEALIEVTRDSDLLSLRFPGTSE